MVSGFSNVFELEICAFENADVLIVFQLMYSTRIRIQLMLCSGA